MLRLWYQQGDADKSRRMTCKLAQVKLYVHRFFFFSFREVKKENPLRTVLQALTKSSRSWWYMLDGCRGLLALGRKALRAAAWRGRENFSFACQGRAETTSGFFFSPCCCSLSHLKLSHLRVSKQSSSCEWEKQALGLQASGCLQALSYDGSIFVISLASLNFSLLI